jgi:Arc/MetJ-type ribon-helix-helix transcriptional regulator
MPKEEKRPRGRPAKEGAAMQQRAVRLPDDIWDGIDAIIESRHGEGNVSSVMRELLREALSNRAKQK